ncbi:MAG: hypothetical protein GY805_08250 [Chloroflexi bacterium]|nr:hypothetical protein [Chloroflexota bacterium]
MQEDYIEDDFLEEESSSNRRPFLIAVGVLVSLFIIMGACTAFFLVNNRAATRSDEVAVIKTRNAETIASNVETRVSLTETAEAIPTNTVQPTAEATETAKPSTPTPTNTPVVEEENGEEALVEVESTPEGEDEGDTAVSEDEADVTDGEDGDDDTNGNKDSEDAGSTSDSALSETDAGSDDALPQTGLDSWGIVVAAFVFVGLLIFARRLRAAG